MLEDRYHPSKMNATPSLQVGCGIEQTDQVKAFASVRAELDIAIGAASASQDSLLMLCKRLGVEPIYGVGIAEAPEPPISGEIDATERAARRVTEMARSLRGLAETLESRL